MNRDDPRVRDVVRGIIDNMRAELARAGLDPMPDVDLDQATTVMLEVMDVSVLVTGGDNSLALGRALDVDDDTTLRILHYVGSMEAILRVTERRKRAGAARPQPGPREVQAILDAVNVGAELSVAVKRLRDRGEL